MSARDDVSAYDGTTDTEVYAAVLTGLVGNDYLAVWAPGNFDDANAGENKTVTVKEEDVIYCIKGDANYDVTFPDAITGTIEKRPATVKAGSLEKDFGEADPTLTAAVDGIAVTVTPAVVHGDRCGQLRKIQERNVRAVYAAWARPSLGTPL